MKRGFTLIELLVVIAIIGLLSSVVLASLNTARNKGSDAAIKQNLAGIRPQAEIYYDTAGNYGAAFGPLACPVVAAVGGSAGAGTLFADATIANQLTAASKVLAAANTMATAACVSSAGAAGAWAVSVPLKSTPADSWCVDSRGIAKQVVGFVGVASFTGVACK
ncbi:MAG: type II secretion system protein [Candidatus Pacebacteria bacterium]|nr:type II secretion system protein [Candidatus Paceibacterota bacterium]